MKTNKDRFEILEKKMDGIEKMPGMLGAVMKNVVLPQLKSIPDAEFHKVRASVKEIIDGLREAFDL